VSKVYLGDTKICQGPLDGVVEAGSFGHVDSLLEYASGFFVAPELSKAPVEMARHWLHGE
jgi:hypothetical protein